MDIDSVVFVRNDTNTGTTSRTIVFWLSKQTFIKNLGNGDFNYLIIMNFLSFMFDHTNRS